MKPDALFFIRFQDVFRGLTKETSLPEAQNPPASTDPWSRHLPSSGVRTGLRSSLARTHAVTHTFSFPPHLRTCAGPSQSNLPSSTGYATARCWGATRRGPQGCSELSLGVSRCFRSPLMIPRAKKPRLGQLQFWPLLASFFQSRSEFRANASPTQFLD